MSSQIKSNFCAQLHGLAGTGFQTTMLCYLTSWHTRTCHTIVLTNTCVECITHVSAHMCNMSQSRSVPHTCDTTNGQRLHFTSTQVTPVIIYGAPHIQLSVCARHNLGTRPIVLVNVRSWPSMVVAQPLLAMSNQTMMSTLGGTISISHRYLVISLKTFCAMLV